MNQFRCETCKDILCECNPKQEGIQFSPNWIFTRRYGCASHNDFQSERIKVLNGDWVRDKFFEWVNSRERPPSIYACGKKWEELRQSKQDGE